MTGYMCTHMRHRCPTDGCYLAQLPSWDDIIECFPRKIRPTDIDGFVEINGHLLFLEEKRQGVGPDEGQRRALRVLSSAPDVTTVFFRPGRSSDLEVLIFDQTDPIGWQPYARSEFLAWIRRWVVDAESRAAA